MAKKKAVERRYQTLDETTIVATLERLHNRIVERFPSRGLAQTAAFLIDLAKDTAAETARLRRTNWILLALQAAAFVVALSAGLFAVVLSVDWATSLWGDLGGERMPWAEFTQGIDAAFNIAILVGLGYLSLANWETRIKRRAALDGLYRLRAVSHVIDMHQLTKDPASIIGDERTGSSPERDLSQTQLLRYLDYCAEMLAMIGKLAALYVQGLPDPVVIDSANDIEVLTSNLSRKIWQKIQIVKDERVGAAH